MTLPALAVLARRTRTVADLGFEVLLEVLERLLELFSGRNFFRTRVAFQTRADVEVVVHFVVVGLKVFELFFLLFGQRRLPAGSLRVEVDVRLGFLGGLALFALRALGASLAFVEFAS